jgi:CxxC-x17-CxxC domain-containing protein
VSYADKPLTCRDCGTPFTFTSGEQEFFAQKGFTNEPGRCPTCRAARRSQRSGGSPDYGSDADYERQPRQLYEVTCSECGGVARVPFQPRGDKPVYCSNCFDRQRSARW